jgi:hypothetical protein
MHIQPAMINKVVLEYSHAYFDYRFPFFHAHRWSWVVTKETLQPKYLLSDPLQNVSCPVLHHCGTDVTEVSQKSSKEYD